MDDLPSVTAFEIKEDLHNFQERFDSSMNFFQKKGNIVGKINSIFSSNNHVYKSKVKIFMKDKVLEKVIIGKTNTDLLTFDGEKIPIMLIYDIEKL